MEDKQFSPTSQPLKEDPGRKEARFSLRYVGVCAIASIIVLILYFAESTSVTNFLFAFPKINLRALPALEQKPYIDSGYLLLGFVSRWLLLFAASPAILTAFLALRKAKGWHVRRTALKSLLLFCLLWIVWASIWDVVASLWPGVF